MEIASNRTGLVFRLGVLVTAMLFGQQALAEGTRAGTLVENDVSVDYEVGSVAQSTLTAEADFVVDRRVNFELSVTDVNLAPVTPGGPPTGDPDYYVEFTLSNTSNGAIDFALALNQINNVAFGANSDLDNVDLTTVDYAVSADVVSGANPDPVRGGADFVDQLEADESIRIWVFADPQLGLANGDIAGVSLTATGAEPGSGGATPLDDTTDTALGIDNVFADTDNDNSEVAEDGFVVVAATLDVQKAYNVIAGDLGSGLPIPGATVEYTITITNSSTDADAENVSITDTLDGDVDFVFGAYSGSDIEINNNGTVTQCTADVAASDADGCSLDGLSLVVGNANGPITLSQDTGGGPVVLTVTFRVTIPDPDPTP